MEGKNVYTEGVSECVTEERKEGEKGRENL